jgi:hypothetical protein
VTNTVVIPPGTADALDALCAEHPALAPTIEGLMVAVHLFARDMVGRVPRGWLLCETPGSRSARAPSVHALAAAIGVDPWSLALALLALADVYHTPGTTPTTHAIGVRGLFWWRYRRSVCFEVNSMGGYLRRDMDRDAARYGVTWPRGWRA